MTDTQTHTQANKKSIITEPFTRMSLLKYADLYEKQVREA